MLLPPHELELFFKLHRALLFFVNQRLTVIPDTLASPGEFAALSPGVRLKVRDALSANLDLIESFRSVITRPTCRTTNSTSCARGGIR